MKGYRFVKENLKSEHGNIQWVLGEWQKCEGKSSLCETGLHASQKPLDSLNYIFGTRWFECEARGKILKDSDKFCASEMRLLQEIPQGVLIQFAIDCAKKALLVFEKEYPNNKQLRKVVKAAELYLKNPNALTCDAARTAYDASEAACTASAARATWAAYDASKTDSTTRAAWAARAARAAYTASKAAYYACYAISEAACEAASEAAWAARAACEAVSEVARAAWATCNDWAACEDVMKKWQNRHLLNLIRKEGK